MGDIDAVLFEFFQVHPTVYCLPIKVRKLPIVLSSIVNVLFLANSFRGGITAVQEAPSAERKRD